MGKITPMTSVRFGWFEWDGEKAVSLKTRNPLPAVWQTCHYSGGRIPAGDVSDQDSYEGIMPLENGCSAWLFGTLHNGLWEVSMSLYAPCPEHNDHVQGVRHCEFWAVLGSEPGTITQHSGCAGFFCDGCWHTRNSIEADPGDDEEFWDVMRKWSSLKVIHNPEIAPHDDEYKRYEGLGQMSAIRIKNGEL